MQMILPDLKVTSHMQSSNQKGILVVVVTSRHAMPCHA